MILGFTATVRDVVAKMEDRIARVRLEIPAQDIAVMVRVIAYAYGRVVSARLGEVRFRAEVSDVRVRADRSSTLLLTTSLEGDTLKGIVNLSGTVPVRLKFAEEGGERIAG